MTVLQIRKSKSYADSKISDLNVFRSCALSKNKFNLYVITADISDVLILVEMLEKLIILHAHSAIISKVLIIVDVSENKAILYANSANISTTTLFLESIGSDFNNLLIFIFERTL